MGGEWIFLATTHLWNYWNLEQNKWRKNIFEHISLYPGDRPLEAREYWLYLADYDLHVNYECNYAPKKIIKKRSSTKKDKKKSFRNLGKKVKTGGHGKMKQDWAAHVNLTKHIEKFDKKKLSENWISIKLSKRYACMKYLIIKQYLQRSLQSYLHYIQK